jgi:hypothetical protein
MAATFIKKNDGNYYMRLTDSTTSVKFAAATGARNFYNFFIAGSDSGTITISRPQGEAIIFYTSSANPVPAGGTLNNGLFTGTETAYAFSGSGIRDYSLSFNAGPTGGTFFALGGESLTFGGNAYPGDGYVDNPVIIGVKTGNQWKSAGNVFVKTGNVWKECQTVWIKTGGTWKKFYENFGNSSWINMIELTDDALDFAVQAIALN